MTARTLWISKFVALCRGNRVRAVSVAFTRWTEGAKEDWPEFAQMLGARGANHRINT